MSVINNFILFFFQVSIEIILHGASDIEEILHTVT
jgi:hypothetical protein